MTKRTPKKYNVTVSYAERTHEEVARLEAQLIDVIYRCKMAAMKKQANEKR